MELLELETLLIDYFLKDDFVMIDTFLACIPQRDLSEGIVKILCTLLDDTGGVLFARFRL